MKKKLVFLSVIIFIVLCIFSVKTYAADLDVIKSFIINASPRENGTVDFSYQIKWKVLDSTSEGPLTWVKIGLPNSRATSIKAHTDNIDSIKKEGSHLRIDFDGSYEAGETITFAFSFNQPHLCEVKDEEVIYEYIPAWFNECKVENLVISWDGDGTVRSNNNKTDGDLLIWEKENLNRGQKVKVEVHYEKSYFSDSVSTKSSGYSGEIDAKTMLIFCLIIIGVGILSTTGKMRGRTNPYNIHRGYYGTYRPTDNTTINSGYYESRAMKRERRREIWNDDDDDDFWGSFGSGSSSGSSGGCACACACAGSGRAGCSKKDFYGTKLKSEMIIEELEK